MPPFMPAPVCRTVALALLVLVASGVAAEPSPAVATESVATPADASPLVLLPGLRQKLEDRLAKVRAARAEAAPPAASGAEAPQAARSAEPSAGKAVVSEGRANDRPDSKPPGKPAARPLEQPLASRPARAVPPPLAPAMAPQGVASHGAAAPATAVRPGPKLPPAHQHWSYEGEGGPESWGRLQPEFATCASGQRQSPIDIRDGIAVELEPIAFEYQPGAFRVIDNGHTVQVNVAPGNFVGVGGRRYELLQFHFHRPSEERIAGRQFAMVVHLVHRSADGRLAVVAVLLDEGPAHPLVQLVWNNLPLEKHEEQAAPMPLDPASLLPNDRRYYTYMGSLTTPPCTEGVLWLVMKQPVTLSPEQAAIFGRLYPMNARPIQPGSGRLVKESK